MVPLSAALSTIGLTVATITLDVGVPNAATSTTAAILSGGFPWKLHSRVSN